MGNPILKTQEINIPRREFDSIVERFPEDKQKLKNSVQQLGNVAILRLADVANEVSENLYDELHERSLRLLNRDRFFSYYLQVFETLHLPRSRVNDILEVGPGIGLYKTLLNSFGYNVETLDLVADTYPDIVGSILEMPIADERYDLICAFQVLEHLPFSNFESAVEEMLRCSKRYIFISLPCQESYFYIQLRFNYLRRFFHHLNFRFEKLLRLPLLTEDIDVTSFKDREDKHSPHYWEVGRKSFPRERILGTIRAQRAKIVKDLNNPYFPYHYFILAEKT